MKKKFKVMLGSAAILGVLGATVINVLFTVPAGPVMTDNINIADFESQCVKHDINQVLDDNGELHIAVWNIYKQQKSGWQRELGDLLKSNQLVMLQEAKLSPELKLFLRQYDVEIEMVNAFSMKGNPNGVMNLARTESTESCAIAVTEPWLRLPKSSLVSQYPLSNGQHLLVVNLHSINFEWRLSQYRAQLNAIAQQVKDHQGPVIMAGDFNTWRPKRMQTVTQFMQQFGLTPVSYHDDKRTHIMGMPLDHIFYRGLTLVKDSSVKTNSSDHNQLTATFKL
ncbi:endonuclease/exonuclease/phosphatase family protein [Shewanella marina]|uniref:endonuclease/exonuclease/phosphatase family protein n=1 Tax=Shewanella marina TaxID=487319 RepID=UPI000472E80F|nr:endonuclease/exonuclease/phosphatase family protein [Shewanella marina]